MSEIQKIIFLLWPADLQSPEEAKKLMLETCISELVNEGAEKIVIYVKDDLADVRSPAPKPLFEKLPVASVEVWLKEGEKAAAIEKLLSAWDFACAAYRVEESIYREYGGNPHMKERDWPDGERSPGIVSVNLLKRPKKMPRDIWVENWFAIMSPVSEAIQPRGRYVRNMVLENLSPGMPVYDGIVIEAWPSKRHVENPFLFYGASNPFQLIRNVLRILKAVRSFLKVRQVRSIMMSEYFIKTLD